MQVRDAMTSPAVTVAPDDTLHAATGLLLRHHIGCVVVVDSGPTGILTSSDVLRTAHRSEEPLADRLVRHGMSADLVTTTEGTAIATALGTMEEHGVKKLPVVEPRELVGILTMTDIAQHQPERVREVRRTVERRDEWTA